MLFNVFLIHKKKHLNTEEICQQTWAYFYTKCLFAFILSACQLMFTSNTKIETFSEYK
jgi:hypothetical protein